LIVDPKNVEESERDVLKRLTSLIKERDPDVVEGHNLFRFDLPYLVARARKAKVKLDWGRSGGFLRSRPSRLQIAEKTIDYPKFTIEGRHFVDTFLLAQFYDVGMRTLSGFERADVARHFGFCDSEELSALTGKELQRAYIDNDERFRERALCAVRETRAVADLLSPSYFIQAQIFPYNYQDVIVRGNATRINALFLREYFRQRHSIPEMPMVRGFEGGYTAIFHRRRAQRLALRHRLSLSLRHVAVRLLSHDRPASDFSASAYRSAHFSVGNQDRDAQRGKR
jgi:DNA polymerase I